jgi:DNA repair photolyase
MMSVHGYIERKTMLYVTGVEYGDYTMNHVLGCAHGCMYPCYAQLLKRRFGQVLSYDNWISPLLVSNTLELLDKEIPRLKSKIRSVHLCFTTDPFMYGYDEIAEMSLSAIKMLNNAGIKCTVLSKGVLPIQLISCSDNNEYGITLISLDENYRKLVEPGAAPFYKRLAALKSLHNKGCKTWVSIEPYPTPNLIDQNLNEILDSISFTDKIIFGRTNYSKSVTAFKDNKTFYNMQAQSVISFCRERNIKYHIKNGTITSR